MKKLLVATTNPGKIAQIKSVLHDLPVNLVFLSDLNMDLKVEENGKTLEENALLKATTYSKAAGLWALADDMGLEIDILNGEPGVRSRRWPGYEATDEELIQLTLEKLKSVPFEKRTASFRSVIAIANPEGKTWCIEGVSRGYISESPSETRIKGLPYACLFYIPEYQKIFTELTDKEKEETGHRIKALKNAKKLLRDIFL